MLDHQREGFTLEYRRLAEAIPALIWIADETGRTIYANRRWYDFTGLDITGRDPDFVSRELVHPLDRHALSEAWEGASTLPGPIEVAYRLRTFDGSYRWVSARAVPLRDDDGTVRQWLGAAIDINAQQTAADYLREMMEAVPQIVFTSGPQTDADYYNRRWYDLTGQTEFEATGTGWQDAVHPDDLAGLIDRAALARAAGVPYTAEFRVRRKADGTYRWHTVTSRPVLDTSGEIMKWVGIATDIEDQKRREAGIRFVADVSELLSSSFNVEERLKLVAERAVPEIADWFLIFLNRDGWFDPVAISHRDAARVERVTQRLARFPKHLKDDDVQSLEAGRTLFTPIVTDAALCAMAVDEAHLALLRDLELRSAVRVPIMARGRLLGYVRAATSESGRIFSSEDVQLLDIVARRIGVALDNARIYERERRVANTFQQAALPPALPELPGVSLSAIYHPAESEPEIGGDWYDAFTIGTRTLVLSMGDVSGKGLDAAVLMSLVRQAIRVAALESEECARTIVAADRALQMEHPGHIVSAIVIFVDLLTLDCRYVNAGHPPPLIRDAGGAVRELPEINPPLGVVAQRLDCVGYVRLQKDSFLALYTDGLIESTHDVVEGDLRVREALAHDAMAHTPNPARLLYDTVLDREPRDDVAILTVSFGRNRHWSFDARDAARAQGARASFVRHLRDQGDPDSDFAGAEVIFGELTGNVVRYSPGPIEIDLEWTEEEPVLHVLDRGGPFVPQGGLPADLMSENGRGLFIVRTLGRNLRVTPLPRRGNHVSIRLPVRRKR